MQKRLTASEKEKIILSRLSVNAQEAVLRDPKKQAEVSKIVHEIFKQHKEDISELSRT